MYKPCDFNCLCTHVVSFSVHVQTLCFSVVHVNILIIFVQRGEGGSCTNPMTSVAHVDMLCFCVRTLD